MDKWLTIPKNAEGMNEYDIGVESSDNLSSIQFPAQEFDLFFQSGTVDKINEVCGTGIADFESEEIPAMEISNALELVSKNDYPVLYAALEKAMDYGMPLYMDF